MIGVDVELPKPLPYLPGQYCKVQFRGFPREMLTARPIRWRDLPTTAPAAFSHPQAFRRGCLLGARPQNPHRASREGDGAVWQRLSAAKSRRQHCSRRQRHRFRADVVDRGRRDHGAAAAGTDLRGRGAKASVAVYAPRAVPPGAVSQRHDHSDRIGAAIRLLRHPHRTANRSSAEFVAERCGLHRRCAGHDRGCRGIARTAGASCYTDPFVSSGEPAGQPTMARTLTGWLSTPHSSRPIAQPSRKPAIRTGAKRAAFGNVR